MDARQLDINASTIAQAVRIMAEIKKEIQALDPTFILIQQLPAPVKDKLTETIKNRLAGVSDN